MLVAADWRSSGARGGTVRYVVEAVVQLLARRRSFGARGGTVRYVVEALGSSACLKKVV